jgi:ATP-dependent DNA ligase
MNPPDTDALALLGDIIKWLSAPLFAMVAWAWSTNAKEHEELRKVAESLREAQSSGASKLNDRIMDHIDEQVRELRIFVIAEDAKIMNENTTMRSTVAKVFDKLEAQALRADDRHGEVMKAIHDLATTMHKALATKADK